MVVVVGSRGARGEGGIDNWRSESRNGTGKEKASCVGPWIREGQNVSLDRVPMKQPQSFPARSTNHYRLSFAAKNPGWYLAALVGADLLRPPWSRAQLCFMQNTP